MKIVFTSDEWYHIHDLIIDFIVEKKHTVVPLGAVLSKKSESWISSTVEAVNLIVKKECNEGVFCCWTGTGVSIIANRNREIRAALCTDAETAKGARIWNHANVLCLSNRIIKKSNIYLILNSWFKGYGCIGENLEIETLKKLDL